MFKLIYKYLWLINILKELILVFFVFYIFFVIITTIDDYDPPESKKSDRMYRKKK